MTEDPTASLKAYDEHARRRRAAMAGLAVGVLALSALSLCAGADGLTVGSLLRGLQAPEGHRDALILWHLRLPRTLAAILAGAGLALAGCVMQNLLRNPMASPATLGVSNAAVLGANLAFIILQPGNAAMTPDGAPPGALDCTATGAAFAVALADIALILILTRRHAYSPETIILAGIALGAACTAGTTLLQTFAQDTQLAAAVFWTFGDLGRISRPQLLALAATVIPIAAFFSCNRWNYNAVCAGEEYARSIGVPLRRLRLASLLCAALICAVTVAFLGIIGFVGLVAPQLVRRFAGEDHRILLPGAALAGAAMLLLADIVARTALPGAALPVGAITSLFGAPIFLALLLRRHRRA